MVTCSGQKKKDLWFVVVSTMVSLIFKLDWSAEVGS